MRLGLSRRRPTAGPAVLCLVLPIAGEPADRMPHEGKRRGLLTTAKRSDQVLVRVLITDVLDPDAEGIPQRRSDNLAAGLGAVEEQAVVVRQIERQLSSPLDRRENVPSARA